MENPNGGSQVVQNFQLEDFYGVAGAGNTKDRHVVNIQLGDDAIACAKGPFCVVCTESLEWVTVGRCGHRVVCSKCMIRIRHVDGDKSCCVCRAHCPTVMVTRATDHGAGAAASSFREYWYHTKTAAYFDDMQQYQAAREACRKGLSPYYHPLYFTIPLLVAFIIMGAVFGSVFAEQTKHKDAKVAGYALSIFVFVSGVTFCWSMYKCNRDPYEEDDEELSVIARNLEMKTI